MRKQSNNNNINNNNNNHNNNNKIIRNNNIIIIIIIINININDTNNKLSVVPSRAPINTSCSYNSAALQPIPVCFYPRCTLLPISSNSCQPERARKTRLRSTTANLLRLQHHSRDYNNKHTNK